MEDNAGNWPRRGGEDEGNVGKVETRMGGRERRSHQGYSNREQEIAEEGERAKRRQEELEKQETAEKGEHEERQGEQEQATAAKVEHKER